MKHYDFEISQFIDNELSPNEQKELFLHLSGCEECRNLLSDFMGMKKDTGTYYNSISVELKPSLKLLGGNTIKVKRNIYKPLFYMSVAASIVLVLLFLTKLFSVANLETKLSALDIKYTRIKNAYNGGIQTDISKNIKTDNRSLWKNKNVIFRKNNKIHPQKNNPELLAENEPLSEGAKNNYHKHSQFTRQIPVVQVTKSDFLTPQIVGN